MASPSRRTPRGDSAEKDRLTRLAWIYHGYADHFLQDSFAAGHLINKTLVMQWFIEWAADGTYLHIEDWDVIKDMTYDKQPEIMGRYLYQPVFPGPSNDPQTVEELPTAEARRKASLVKGDANAYQQYLTFLSSVIAQAAANAVHDKFNEKSVWVASTTDAEPYLVYGDDTLFRKDGACGAQRTSETAHMSQESIRELLERGTPTSTRNKYARSFLRGLGQARTSCCHSRTGWRLRRSGPVTKSSALRNSWPNATSPRRTHAS